jgi:hypothetical protein
LEEGYPVVKLVYGGVYVCRAPERVVVGGAFLESSIIGRQGAESESRELAVG